MSRAKGLTRHLEKEGPIKAEQRRRQVVLIVNMMPSSAGEGVSRSMLRGRLTNVGCMTAGSPSENIGLGNWMCKEESVKSRM